MALNNNKRIVIDATVLRFNSITFFVLYTIPKTNYGLMAFNVCSV